MPLESNTRIVTELARRGYNAEREAVTLLAGAPDPEAALEAAVEHAPEDALRITSEHARDAIDGIDGADGHDVPNRVDAGNERTGDAEQRSDSDPAHSFQSNSRTARSSGNESTSSTPSQSEDDRLTEVGSPDEIKGSASTGSEPRNSGRPTAEPTDSAEPEHGDSPPVEPNESTSAIHVRDAELRDLSVGNDMTGHSTGTGEYDDFVRTFRDRYERLSKVLRGRVNHRPAEAIASMPGGSDAAMIGLVNDVRSTKSGHWLIELEDTTGTFSALVMKDKGLADVVDEILMDECLAIEGTLADDAGILFADSLHFPDIPRTHRPDTADRHVQAALISDVHVGSDEFMAEAWHRFTDWLHTPEAAPVEYLLIAGDMVEGVGVYPNQDEELDIVDIYEQYEQFAEYLKEVPGDTEIVMIPGNHDAVRLAEPQPGFNEELRAIMDVHDPRIVSNPATVSVEGVDVLMYHGVSLDEVIAELPEEKASYDEPHKAMYQLLKKRHVAPQFGGHTRVAPEERDYLVMDGVPDVFHTGHVHKIGWGKYHNVLAVNSGCWQAQTDFQKSVNIDPDAGFAPILDLDTLEMTVRKFA